MFIRTQELFVISCIFRLEKDGEDVDGLAVCKDPDTPISFVFPDGKVHYGEVWKYTLAHHRPWSKFDVLVRN